ncbi:MAG: glycosyltransferase family 4 protein [Verrucomicrobiaceae bacterium]|nr:glycosyltransferase family 4 protein [Verrucomicrobiaceae bacterium]
MRLLVTAFSLSPGRGSEPGVGWHTVEELAREHELHALVDANWEPKVQRVFRPEEHPRIHLHFVRIPVLTSLVEGPLNSGLCWLIYYYLWQIAAWITATRLHDQHRFDACQHVTFVKYNTPSFLHLLGLPFIFGPVGGAERAPAQFYREFGLKTRFAEAARVALQKLALLDPFLRLCCRRSTIALGVTHDTAEALRKLGAHRVEVLTAVALSEDELATVAGLCEPGPDADGTSGRLGWADAQAPSKPHVSGLTEASYNQEPLALLYVGRLIAWKGVHLALRALAQRPSHLRFRIIGDGPLRPYLEAEAQRLGLADRVIFEGELPRDQVLAAYRGADGFLYPSLHDSGGNAVLEAMAAALPILCLRYGGPDFIVGDDCGWKVQAITPDAAIDGLASALHAFATDIAERATRGAAARARCLHDFTWTTRGAQLREHLRSIVPR